MRLIHKRLSKRAALLLTVALVAGVLILLILSKPIYDGLVALDLIPQPEKLTELYFNDHEHLPKSATSNQAIDFAFVIHNLETTDFQYSYTISVDAGDTQQIVDSGKILVKNNQYYTKNVHLNLLNAPGSQMVIVELTNKQQFIYFRTGQQIK
jgi:hypothetical protein